ncbi:hypothetical protein Tco_0205416 [Tanacetum coccineum]
MCKVPLVALIPLEAEYVAAASCCSQELWLQNQLLDYGFNFMNTIIHIDNQSTICIIKNPVYHSKTKHIEIRHHFIRDCYEKKLIQVQKIHTDLNVADLLTKAFDGPRFNFLLVNIGMIWPSAMKLDLQARNKFAFVDGSCVKSAFATSDVLYAQWDGCNVVVLTWIMNSVSSHVYVGLVYFVDAASCVKSAFATSIEQDDCYQSVKSALLTKDPLPEVKDAYTTVSRKESYRGIPQPSSVTESKINATFFVAKGFNVNKRNNFSNSNNNNNNGQILSITIT